MMLTEKEMTTIKDLQTQEETCIKKYERYSQQAHDTQLQSLFRTLKENEQQHYNSLAQVLKGSVPRVDCNDTQGQNYNPTRTYDQMTNSEEKKEDCFLATDCIGTEKLVSSEYNTNVFTCSDSQVRKLLADIQIEEQNHAEMLYKYKQVNGMS